MTSGGRGWDASSDALARRALTRAREAAFAKGLRPVRPGPAQWEMASFGPPAPPAAGGGPVSSTAAGGSTGTAGTTDTAGASGAGAPADEAAPEVSPSGWRAGPGLGSVGSGPGPSRRDPQGLGNLTSRVLAEHGWTRPLVVAGVVGRWEEIVGPAVAEHCHVERFTDGELVVRAESTPWATQLRLLLPQIERRIAEEVGEGAVASIEVRGPGGPTWKRGAWSVTGGRGPRDTYG